MYQKTRDSYELRSESSRVSSLDQNESRSELRVDNYGSVIFKFLDVNFLNINSFEQFMPILNTEARHSRVL